ncbi:uncharacterized protein BJ212DRAFT_1361153 [Suillus subaureus]|uniref:Uncharacterized protein n=1 Tax=Suillus subaureus TaxID=48587 RepID=A0A9P7E8Q9_9AGAM|nr:uncharacterized protein BJ212DRAFT_1361153 [Suillus subaureus]KAG1814652.1 hypothetical protein BJ212DRAFT_1361153 [Suillus subaureus]
MTTHQPSNSQGLRAEKLVALPSLTCGLSSLPQAKSMDSVSLHPNMYAQRAAQSEAKLKNVLSKTAASHSQAPPPVPTYMNPVRDARLTMPRIHADRRQFFFPVILASS